VRDVPSQPCVCAEPGRNGKGFTTFFLMRRDPISVEALQLRRHLFTSWLLAYPRTLIYCPIWSFFGLHIEHNLLHTEIPVPWLARIGPWESRSLRDVRRSWSSSARVKTIGDHVFEECLRHDYSPFVFGALRCGRHCIERDDYTDKCYVN
jgi:hypothetical protein